MMALCTPTQVDFAETYLIKPFAALPTANAKGHNLFQRGDFEHCAHEGEKPALTTFV